MLSKADQQAPLDAKRAEKQLEARTLEPEAALGIATRCKGNIVRAAVKGGKTATVVGTFVPERENRTGMYVVMVKQDPTGAGL